MGIARLEQSPLMSKIAAVLGGLLVATANTVHPVLASPPNQFAWWTLMIEKVCEYGLLTKQSTYEEGYDVGSRAAQFVIDKGYGPQMSTWFDSIEVDQFNRYMKQSLQETCPEYLQQP